MCWLTSCYSVCVHVAWCKDWKPGGSFGQSSSPQCPGSPPHGHHQLPGQGAVFSSSLAHLLIHFLSIFLFFFSHHMLIILWSVPYFTTHSFLLILIGNLGLTCWSLVLTWWSSLCVCAYRKPSSSNQTSTSLNSSSQSLLWVRPGMNTSSSPDHMWNTGSLPNSSENCIYKVCIVCTST